MSILRLAKIALGLSTAAVNNFSLRAMDDGKLRISRGNADAEIRDVLTIHADDALSAKLPLGRAALKASASGTSAMVSVSADTLNVTNSDGMARMLRAVAVTINTASAGANGLDSGALAALAWYAVFVICKDDGTTAGLISLSATAPALPAGYTHFARVGWIRTDGTANKYPLGFTQHGNRVQYKLGGNLATLPMMSTGVKGSIAATVYVALPVGNFVPPTACVISLTGMDGGAAYGIAPNASYGSVSPLSATTFPPISSNGTTACTHTADLVLEGTNIYHVSGASTASVACLGWEDNL